MQNAVIAVVLEMDDEVPTHLAIAMVNERVKEALGNVNGVTVYAGIKKAAEEVIAVFQEVDDSNVAGISGPNTFVKKPVEIEAVRFTGDNWNEMQNFCGTHRDSGDQWDIPTFNVLGAYLQSDDEELTAEVWDKLHSSWVGVKDGQWIIKGIQGEFYPCDHEVFAKSYDPVPQEG